MLYFIHIPKTAGTSLRRVLQDHIYRNRLRTIYYDLGYWNAAEARANLGLTGREVLYGHFCYGVHRLLHDPRGRYMTMLRHPVERVCSLYRHFKRRAATGSPGIVPADNLTLRDFVESGCSAETNNHITRMLAANYARAYRWKYHASNWYARTVHGLPHHQVHSRRELRRALVNLRERFEFVGFTENFAASMDYLLRLNGIPREGIEMPMDNVADAGTAVSLDPGTRAAIETANDLDLALYHAVKSDPERYHAVGP